MKHIYKIHTQYRWNIHTIQIPEAHYNLADVLFGSGNSKQALTAAEAAIKVKSGMLICYVYI